MAPTLWLSTPKCAPSRPVTIFSVALSIGGAKDVDRIYCLCYTLDKLQSKWPQKSVRHPSCTRMRKVAARIRLKIRNLVDNLHKHLAKWLCENYEVVLLPTFETSQMLRRGQRRIRSKTAHAMATWSHYRSIQTTFVEQVM